MIKVDDRTWGSGKNLLPDRFFPASPTCPGVVLTKPAPRHPLSVLAKVENFYWSCCKTQFCNSPIFFIFKYNYLQINTSLTEKSTIFPGIFTFPQTISLSNTKKFSDARTRFCWLGITKNSAQPRVDCFPPVPPCSDRRGIQREITNDPYIRAGAYAPLHGLA